MRRFLPLFLALFVGVAIGWLLHRPPAPPSARPPEPIDFTQDISIRYGHDGARILRPHHLIVDDHPRQVGPIPASAPAGVWVLRLDGGRVQIACTDVTP